MQVYIFQGDEIKNTKKGIQDFLNFHVEPGAPENTQHIGPTDSPFEWQRI